METGPLLVLTASASPHPPSPSLRFILEIRKRSKERQSIFLYLTILLPYVASSLLNVARVLCGVGEGKCTGLYPRFECGAPPLPQARSPNRYLGTDCTLFWVLSRSRLRPWPLGALSSVDTEHQLVTQRERKWLECMEELSLLRSQRGGIFEE